VIVKIPNANYSGTTTGSVTTTPSHTIITFNSPGTYSA
jgi:hypothetical protein